MYQHIDRRVARWSGQTGADTDERLDNCASPAMSRQRYRRRYLSTLWKKVSDARYTDLRQIPRFYNQRYGITLVVLTQHCVFWSGHSFFRYFISLFSVRYKKTARKYVKYMNVYRHLSHTHNPFVFWGDFPTWQNTAAYRCRGIVNGGVLSWDISWCHASPIWVDWGQIKRRSALTLHQLNNHRTVFTPTPTNSRAADGHRTSQWFLPGPTPRDRRRFANGEVRNLRQSPLIFGAGHFGS